MSIAKPFVAQISHTANDMAGSMSQKKAQSWHNPADDKGMKMW